MNLLGYQFRNIALLTQSLTHRSYAADRRGSTPADPTLQQDNERLELLGDTVLELIVTEMLLKALPHALEGQISKSRAALVNERILAHLARSLGLGADLLLGRGEENSGGRDKDSILASGLEAVAAAVYLDGGFDAAQRWGGALFAPAVKEAVAGDIIVDYKTKLQELLQAKLKIAPKYITVSSSGPDHDKTFLIEINVAGKVLAQGSGKSKKEAEQDAARAVLAQYGVD